jgi:hypothetical protein
MNLNTISLPWVGKANKGPKGGESHQCVLNFGKGQDIRLKNEKSSPKNGIPFQFFGGKFHSVKLVSLTL